MSNGKINGVAFLDDLHLPPTVLLMPCNWAFSLKGFCRTCKQIPKGEYYIPFYQFECNNRTERTFISKPQCPLNKLFKHLAYSTLFARVYYKEERLVSKENLFGLHTEQKITQMRMNLCVILERVQQQEIFFKIRKKSKFENKILHLRDTYLLNSVPQKLCQERTS